VLATTRPSYSVVLTPSRMTPESYAQLRAALGPQADGLPGWETLLPMAKDRNKTLLAAKDVSRETMVLIETSLERSGIQVVVVPHRYYPGGALAAAALGYMNEVSAEEVRTRKREGYRPGDLIGRTGLERFFEPYLRGRKGFEKLVIVPIGMRRSDLRIADLATGPMKQDPGPGHNIILSLDSDVQRIAERALRNTRASAAVVLEIDTGRILAMVSRPTFDPNVMSGRLTPEIEARMLSNPLRPFGNKAIADTYNPASTFKPVSALTALEEKLLTPEDRVHCGGYVQIGRRRFKCSKAHGSVNLHAAIVQSCNVYFYELGARPGILARSGARRERRGPGWRAASR
jgi:penicillin-binding protein 2